MQHACGYLKRLRADLYELGPADFQATDSPAVPVQEAVPRTGNRSLDGRGTLRLSQDLLGIWTDEENRALNLVPSEETQYSGFFSVPRTGVFEIRVALSGTADVKPSAFRFFGAGRSAHTYYWTASAITHPKPEASELVLPGTERLPSTPAANVITFAKSGDSTGK